MKKRITLKIKVPCSTLDRPPKSLTNSRGGGTIPSQFRGISAMNSSYYHYVVDEWRYSQPTNSEKIISFWTSPRETSPRPLTLTLICGTQFLPADKSIGSVSLIQNLNSYGIEDHHEGCVTVSEGYFKDLQTALFATCKLERTGTGLSIGLRDEGIDNAEIYDFTFEVGFE